MDTEFRIGDEVALVSDGGSNGTVVDFVYACHEPEDPNHIRVYWRTAGGVSDHRPRDLVQMSAAPEAERLRLFDLQADAKYPQRAV